MGSNTAQGHTNREQIQAIQILRQGGVVALPTDTVYCLAASLKHVMAIRRIFDIKGRQITKALPVLVADTDQMSQVAELNLLAKKLVRRFMPGGLTLILPKRASVPEIVTGGRNSVAVRIPGDKMILDIIRSIGEPLTGTSANLSGMPSSLSADQVRNHLGNRIDMVLDGGFCSGGIESTIIDLTGERPSIIREGAVPNIDLEQYLL